MLVAGNNVDGWILLIDQLEMKALLASAVGRSVAIRNLSGSGRQLSLQRLVDHRLERV